VDTERDFVGTDLTHTNPLQREYLQSANPVYEAETVSGQAYHSDSRILMLDLRQEGPVIATLPVATSSAQPVLPAKLDSEATLQSKLK
jgi:hypothetical protein